MSTILTSDDKKKGIACGVLESSVPQDWLVKVKPLKIITALFVFLSLFCSTWASATLLNIEPLSVESEAWTILDPQSGQIIAEHNSHVKRAPASLTKMMVAYIALKEINAGKLNKNEILTATPVVNTVQWDESQMYLKPTEQISVDQLLAGLIVMSANDAAVSLAERISGSVPNFIIRMNQEAQALGMKDTHFSNPAGITMDDHFSTAHDLALLGQAVSMKTPDYLYYSKQPSFTYNLHFHRATNVLLKQDPSVDGLKTGFTKAAGYNLALTANRPAMQFDLPNRRLVVVVLGAKNAAKRAEVAHKLMNIAYSYTRNEVAIKDKQIIAELPVIQSTLKMFKVEAKQSRYMTTSLYGSDARINLSDFDNQAQRLVQTDVLGNTSVLEPLQNTKTHMNIELNTQSLTAPLAQIMQLAQIQVYQNNQLIQTFLIEDEVKIEQANALERFLNWFKQLFSFGTDNVAPAKIYPLR